MRRIVIILALIACSASAQNLVVNPHFDHGIAGWDFAAADVSAAWEKVDALASPDSGAIALTATLFTGTRSARQCIPVTGGQMYEAGARVMVDGQQPAAGGFLAGLFYASPACAGPWIETAFLETEQVTAASHGRFTPVAKRIQAPAEAHAVLLWVGIDVPQPGGTVTAHFDDVFFGPAGGCVPDASTLCLNGSRFRVKATYRTAEASTAPPAKAVQLTTDSGYLWFFDPNNIEVTVKVLGACAVNGRQWVFAAGMTNVEVNLTVTDTQTGAIQRYTNRATEPFEVILDTNAFGCP